LIVILRIHVETKVEENRIKKAALSFLEVSTYRKQHGSDREETGLLCTEDTCNIKPVTQGRTRAFSIILH
jgi:hypothetical protein